MIKLIVELRLSETAFARSKTFGNSLHALAFFLQLLYNMDSARKVASSENSQAVNCLPVEIPQRPALESDRTRLDGASVQAAGRERRLSQACM
jgi:hypothetical protein